MISNWPGRKCSPAVLQLNYHIELMLAIPGVFQRHREPRLVNFHPTIIHSSCVIFRAARSITITTGAWHMETDEKKNEIKIVSDSLKQTYDCIKISL